MHISPTGFAAPAVTIKDQPRFPWRGLLIDVSRHFIPIDVLKRNLDGMAAVKMNVLHWHLSDDQGFRVESKEFPKLTGMGSDGMFYTQDEIRDLIAYAHDRGIRVMPEFDIPGHSRSWFLDIPSSPAAPAPTRSKAAASIRSWIPRRNRPTSSWKSSSREMAKLFPDAYFHIGGDEVDGKQWDANPQDSGLHPRPRHEEQSGLCRRTSTSACRRSSPRTTKPWLAGTRSCIPILPKTIVVQSWRGQESLAAAAKQGYRGLLSFGYYLDLMWPAARHYAVDPMS